MIRGETHQGQFIIRDSSCKFFVKEVAKIGSIMFCPPPLYLLRPPGVRANFFYLVTCYITTYSLYLAGIKTQECKQNRSQKSNMQFKENCSRSQRISLKSFLKNRPLECVLNYTIIHSFNCRKMRAFA